MRSLVVLGLLCLTSLGVCQTGRDRAAQLAADYGIEVVVLDQAVKYQRRGYVMTGAAVSDAQLEAYMGLLDTEWRRYPRSLMVKTKLKRIVLGTDVRVENQARAAVPEFAEGWFWLDVGTGARIPHYGRHALHHDYFHMIDQWDSPDRRDDKAWEGLNKSGVKYGKGGWYAQTGNTGAPRTDLPGFLNEYAISAVEEDKAEVYGFLLTRRKFVEERVKADPVMAAKVARLKELVRQFEPSMDDAWFDRHGS